MKMKRISRFLDLMFVLVLLIVLQGCASLPKSPPGTKPAITHAFINKEKGRYGDVLKIYIEAEDPRGYMSKIATVVDQVGYGRYATDWVFLGPQYEHHLLGYLQWNTYSYRASRMPEWTQITIKLTILDTDGNESNTVVFPFEFVSEAIPEALLPTPFNQGNLPMLGAVGINLWNPFEMGIGEEQGQEGVILK